MVKQDHSPSSNQERQQAPTTSQRSHQEKRIDNPQRQRKQESLQKTQIKDINNKDLQDQEQGLSQDFDRNEGQGHSQKS